MISKVITVFAFLCVMQGIQSKAINPFMQAFNPMMAFNPLMTDPTLDAELRPMVTEIQMRLTQLNTISKQAIGFRVGQASKSMGMMSSGAKNNLKLLTSAPISPTANKECANAHKDAISQLNSNSKLQQSTCTKSGQMQLKSMNQVQKMMSMQVSNLNSETNVAVSQCKLENPLPTDTLAVTDCVATKTDAIKEKVAALEQEMLAVTSAVETAVSQVIDQANTCSQHVQELVQEQNAVILQQLEDCNAMFAV